MISIQLNDGPKLYPPKYLDPPVLCPNCNRDVQGLVGSDAVVTTGVTHREAMLGTPAYKLRVDADWILFPCYCRVSAYWASAFVEEMSRRIAGQPARSVEALSDKQKIDLIRQLEADLSAAYQRRDAATMAGMTHKRLDIEKQIVQKIGELSRLVPGAHNRMPPITLSDAAVKWAGDVGVTLPAESEKAALSGSAQITPEALLKVVMFSSDFDQMSLSSAREAALAAYANLQQFVNNQSKTLHASTVDLVCRIVPEARAYLSARVAVGAAAGKADAPVFDTPRRQITRDVSPGMKPGVDSDED